MFSTSLIESLRKARHVVVFTGAGVSAESGIPTFRDLLTGLWARFDAASLATPEAFETDPALVWGWYEWRRMKVLQAQPNAAHHAIAELARKVPRMTLISQNVDDLHERAGSTDVIHLHGSLHAPRCFNCGKSPDVPLGMPDEPEGGRRLQPPRCSACGGLLRPGVVWFGESLPVGALNAAFEAAENCDLLISVGTSGMVYPAAEVPELAWRAGAVVVHINPQPQACRHDREYALAGLAGEQLPRLVDSLRNT
ncbi:SIR2 family NAD-dependent protein deacylase [Stutzerimonas stutzeri]|uniref:SIR2 family NAD-dependent protein deacylase n=1 Tax=Stutzerimonas stutzeri TaxID=316 RepID=UPI00210C7976|nr:NAD-dependent deacylase [Stutzerimonas stutzeri]MCQ4258924.1 NAD-dependent deacylase [Stutzerimonas stutzeri]